MRARRKKPAEEPLEIEVSCDVFYAGTPNVKAHVWSKQIETAIRKELEAIFPGARIVGLWVHEGLTSRATASMQERQEIRRGKRP